MNMLDFLKLNCFDSFNEIRYWCYTKSKKVKCFTIHNGVWYSAGMAVESIEEIELILNQ